MPDVRQVCDPDDYLDSGKFLTEDFNIIITPLVIPACGCDLALEPDIS
jgi:hypothetical protein